MMRFDTLRCGAVVLCAALSGACGDDGQGSDTDGGGGAVDGGARLDAGSGAQDAGGRVQDSSLPGAIDSGVRLDAGVALGDAGAPMRNLHCFASPGACGYPDPAYRNVGVPPGTTLRSSGSLTITTEGMLIDGLDINGSIVVRAPRVTIRNTRVTVGAPGCGTTTTCGNSAIRIEAGATDVHISHVELTVAEGGTVEHAVRNLAGPTTHGDHLYVHGIDAAWLGAGTVEDSYSMAVLAITTDHLENSYYGGGGGALVMNHNTWLNPVSQTATIFVKSDFGDITTLTITNNFLAGGGFTLYGGLGGPGRVTGPVTVMNNQFARCGHGAETGPGPGGHWSCPGGPDEHGYFPRGGSYGWQSSFERGVTTWSGNRWDDDGSAVTGP